MRPFKFFATTAVSLGLLISSAHAACKDIPSSLRADGNFLFRSDGRWQTVNDHLGRMMSDGKSRVVNFSYVVSDRTSKARHRGIIVIKSGFDFAKSSDTADSTTVKLVRKPMAKISTCDSKLPYFSDSVSGAEYDRFHDDDVGGNQALQNFHINYAGMKGCRRSDDASADRFFAGRLTSNRSQFSFNQRVVRSGANRQIASFFGIRRAYGDTPFSDRRVEMKKYRADEQGFACVEFSMRVAQGRFIRINDLERRIVLFRKNETTWQLP